MFSKNLIRCTATCRKIHKSDRVVERTGVPELLIRSTAGREAFVEEKAALWPINFFPDEAVNHASRELLDEHRRLYPTEKIMIQVDPTSDHVTLQQQNSSSKN